MKVIYTSFRHFHLISYAIEFLREEIKKAKEENDFDKVRELEYAKKQFEDDYMHRDFKSEFYEKDAPNTVNNFVKLAKEGYYKDLTFHRVLPGFVIQGGCPNMMKYKIVNL